MRNQFLYQALFLIIASLLIQCDCGKRTPNSQEPSQRTPDIQPIPITEEMIRLAREQPPWGEDFLANVLHSLKDTRGEIDINAKDGSLGALGEGLTALHYAAILGNEDIVQALLSRGARVDILDNDNGLPLHYAAKEPGNAKILALLLDKMKPADLEVKYVKRSTPLSLAINFRADLEMIKLLVEKGSKIETKNNDGQTPFSIAASIGRIDVVHYLGDEKGANIDIADNYSHTPLYLAAEKNHVEVIKYLVGKGAWVDIDKQEQDTSGKAFTLRSKITDSAIVQLLTKNP